MNDLIRPNGCGNWDDKCPDPCGKDPCYCAKYLEKADFMRRRHRKDVLLTREMNQRSAEYEQ